MTPPTPHQFPAFYEAVHGYAPFPWQERLAEQVCAGKDWPRAIALPTAAGKTACIDVAVFALACRAANAPRRLFFVVDRRIVVDQAHHHADELAKSLAGATNGILKAVADALRDLAYPGWQKLSEKEQREVRPLDVYALRGGMYRETAWARSPLQPTVIASTVDQVGSRLLFRGYGVSDSMKPVHAALVGNDSLILLDEAHCAKPFQQTAEAVEKYRQWNDSPAPFRFLSITATPTGDGEVMRDDEDDRAHPVLGERIKAKKPARLVVVENAKGKNFTPALVKELKKQAEELAKTAGCVGVIVNWVKTARDLKAELGEDAVLLTGRMRPLDRDRLFAERLKPLLSNATGTPPKFVIGTQCLEVGADFDFHALVTECASLDALRQRFGRLNRVAKREKADAVIVIRGDQTEPKEKESEQDPIYGNSLPNTWKFLTSDGTRTEFDFGVAAVREATNGVDLTPLNAPTENAPVLFPAHLDCWVQTHPVPHPDPDVAVFLHGPKQSGQPDVQVVFRDDLGTDDSKWAEVLALLPPSSSEAVAVPIGLFKKWLAGERLDQTDPGPDIEGGTPEDDDEPEAATPRTAFCWMGEDESTVVNNPGDVRPNRTYVVRSQEADVNRLADFITDPPEDYAEEAFQRSRDKAALRLRGVTVTDEMSDDEAAERVAEAVAALGGDDAPDWRKRAVKELTDPKRRRVENHPAGGVVLVGKRRLHQFDPEFLDDANSSYSPARRQVLLVDHSRGVAERAVRFAQPLGLPVELYRAAGFYHDLGKLDPRFQKMLVGFVPTDPLAKSGTFDQRAWESHRYPKGARHELLSAALLRGHADDLLLHLVATHHGSARPFAKPVDDDKDSAPPALAKYEHWPKCLPQRPPAQDIAGWNAELPERFWRVVREYGWWGGAFREAVFRLADHAQSRQEQEKEWEPTEVPDDVKPPPLAPYAEPQRLHPLPLPGLDGSNPLAFLAAVGTLRLVDELYPGVKIRWQSAGHWHPVLELSDPLTLTAFAERLHTRVHRVVEPSAEATATTLEKAYSKRKKETAAALKTFKARKLKGEAREQALATDIRPLEACESVARREWLVALDRVVPTPFLSLGKSITASGDEFATFARRLAERLHEAKQRGRIDADFVTAFGCEARIERNGRVTPTEFQLIAGSGHQHFLETFGALMECVTVEQLHRCLAGPWAYPDPRLSFRWEPQDDRRYATSWDDPSGITVLTEHGANLLAAFALPLFPVVPTNRTARTVGFHVVGSDENLSWPMWEDPLGIDTVRSLLQSEGLHTPSPSRTTCLALGMRQLFRVRKHEVGTPPLSKWNFSTSIVV